jgi:hypothetical protein
LQVSVTLAAMLGVWGFSARLHANGGVKYFVLGLGALACLGFSVAACCRLFGPAHTVGDITHGQKAFFVKHNGLGFLFLFRVLRFTFPGGSASISADGFAQRAVVRSAGDGKLR